MSKKTIHREFRQFVDNFLGEEHGCLPYLNNKASRVLSLSFVPPDIVSTEEIKPDTYTQENGYYFTNPAYTGPQGEENPFQFDRIYEWDITDSFFQHAFQRCGEKPKYNSIHVETAEGLQEGEPPICLELEKTSPESETSRFVCTDPMRANYHLDNKYDYNTEPSIKCPLYLDNIVDTYQAGKGFCQHFPQIISENFLVVDKCPQEKVIGETGMFENAKGRQLLWDPATQKLRCQVNQPGKGGFVKPQYSLQ
jgi:hypothetical protein